MAVQDSLVEYTVELLEKLGPVQPRRMFGGWGLHFGGKMIGLILNGQLYLKTDEVSRPEFKTAGGQPFVYESRGRSVELSYWTPPAEAADDAYALLPWARKAVAAADRVALKKAQKTPRKKVAATAKKEAATLEKKTAAAKNAAPTKKPTAAKNPAPAKKRAAAKDAAAAKNAASAKERAAAKDAAPAKKRTAVKKAPAPALTPRRRSPRASADSAKKVPTRRR